MFAGSCIIEQLNPLEHIMFHFHIIEGTLSAIDTTFYNQSAEQSHPGIEGEMMNNENKPSQNYSSTISWNGEAAAFVSIFIYNILLAALLVVNGSIRLGPCHHLEEKSKQTHTHTNTQKSMGGVGGYLGKGKKKSLQTTRDEMRLCTPILKLCIIYRK